MTAFTIVFLCMGAHLIIGIGVCFLIFRRVYKIGLIGDEKSFGIAVGIMSIALWPLVGLFIVAVKFCVYLVKALDNWFKKTYGVNK